MTRSKVLLVIALFIAVAMPVTGAASNDVASAVTGTTQLINVGFFTLPGNVQAGGTYNGEKVLNVNHDINFISLEVQNPTVFRARVMLDDNVKYLSNDQIGAVHADLVPNDPSYSQQYGWKNTNAEAGWDITLGTTAVTVAIIDTGIWSTHEEFTGRVLTGTSYVSGGNQLADDNGHGTHVSGTVGAAINNGKGGTGAAQVNLLPVKVLDSAGSGTFAAVANGITWAANNGAHIESMSLGCAAGCYDQGTVDAINYATSKGVLVVVAAGNDGGAVGFPANQANAFAVACTDSSNVKCTFSNSGPEVDISAPGLNIYSTWNCGNSCYNTISGTSMSTPHVSGIAALVKTKNPAFTVTDLRNQLTSTAKPLADAGMGAGLVDSGKALGAGVTPTPPGAPTLSATPGNTQVSLSWTTPSSGGSAITNYKIYRGTTSGGETLLTTVGVVNSYTDTGLTNGVKYYYKVSAVNSIGEGALSNEVSATPSTATAPGAPTGLTAAHSGSKTSGKIALSWTAPTSDGGSAITNYKIYRGTTSGGETLLTTVGNVLSYTDSGLTKGVTYYYKVTAVNAIGESAFSNEASAVG